MHFTARKMIGHFHAAFISLCVSRLSGFTITKKPCRELRDRKGSTDSPSAQLRKGYSAVHPSGVAAWPEGLESKGAAPSPAGALSP